MSDSSPWCLNLGRFHRVNVRVHLLFVAVAVFIVFLATSDPPNDSLAYGLMAVGVLFASVLLHELGHAFVAARAGGNFELIVVGPLGGLAHGEAPRDRHAELIAVVAGALVNLAIVLMVTPVLLATDTPLAPLMSLLAPAGLLEGDWWIVGLKLVFWTNGMLALGNLLPAYPLDGARLLRIVLSPSLDPRGAGQVAVRISKLTAIGLCLLAWLERDARLADVLPTWVPLVLLAVWVYGSATYEAARQDEGDWDDELFHYDFSQGYTSLDRNFETPRRSGNSVRRWIEQRREMRRLRRRSRELEEERQVDEILLRLHETGMDGLTSKERALLNRVSARYRNRQSN